MCGREGMHGVDKELYLYIVVIPRFNIFQHGILTLVSELQAVHVWTKRRTKYTTVFQIGL